MSGCTDGAEEVTSTPQPAFLYCQSLGLCSQGHQPLITEPDKHEALSPPARPQRDGQCPVKQGLSPFGPLATLTG